MAYLQHNVDGPALPQFAAVPGSSQSWVLLQGQPGVGQ